MVQYYYQITQKEPKSDDRLIKFDQHDVGPIFLALWLLHNLKAFQNPTQHHWYNKADQILTYDRKIFIWFLNSNTYLIATVKVSIST